MMPEENSSLNVEAVVRQFTKSAETFDEISEKLNTINYAEDRAGAASQALETTAAQLQQTAKALEDAATELAEASRTARDSLTTAAEFLEKLI